MVTVIENGSTRKDKLLKDISGLIVIMMMLAFTLNYTIVGVVKGSIFSPFKNLTMVAMFLLFVYQFFTVSKDERKAWFTNKVFIIPTFVWLVLFFIVRVIGFISGGCQYDTAREIFFEFVFLVCMCPWTVTGKLNVKLTSAIFIIINLLVNIANRITTCLLIFCSKGYIETNIYIDFIKELDAYQLWESTHEIAPLYSNPNTGGIMTALAVLLSLFFLKKESRRKWIFYGIYWIYSIYEIIQFGARSAYIALITACISIFILLIIKRISPKILVCICLILSVILSVGIYGYVNYNISDNDRTFTKYEQQLNLISSGRYKIWQDAMLAHSDNLILGVGNSTKEKETRNEYLKEELIAAGGNEDTYIPTTFSLHNGYLSTIFINGWIGYILFIIIMLHKVCISKMLDYNNFRMSRYNTVVAASVIIYCLMICHFEAMLLSCRYFTWLFIVLILAGDVEVIKEGEVNAESTSTVE